MADSSDSDIIDRTRHSTYVTTRKRYNSESSQDNDISHEYDDIFYDLFGNGNEYSYIYNTVTKEESDSISESRYIDENACFTFIQKEIPSGRFIGFNREVVSDLIRGYTPEYISIYQNKMTVPECYYIQDLITEFSKEGLNNHMEKGCNMEDYNIEGLLSVKDYIENLKAGERINEPVGNIEESMGWDDEDIPVTEKYSQVIKALARQPVFAAAVKRAVKFEKMGVTDARDAIARLYSTDSYCESNHVRHEIIREAAMRVNVDSPRIEEVLLSQGLISNSTGSPSKFSPHDGSLQNLANAIYSLQGAPGEYVGLFLDKSVCKAVVLSESGEILRRATFKATDCESIRDFIPTTAKVCLTSNTPSIRYFIPKFEFPMFCVPLSFSLFPDEGGAYSVPINIARAVQNPLVYFSRFCDSNSSPRLNPTVYKRAISIACTLLKPDWNETYKYSNSISLFNLLGIQLNDDHFDYGAIRSFEDLRSPFTEVEFDNIPVFFSLKSSTNPLDATHVHPKEYKWATLIFKGTHQGASDISETQMIRNALANPQLLSNASLPDEEIPGSLPFSIIRSMLLGIKTMQFSGSTDEQIFSDVVPSLKIDSVYDGVVLKEGEDFYLIDVNGATIYIRKSEGVSSCHVNQIVKVRVGNKCFRMLSYGGEIVEEERVAVRQFTRHRLYFQGTQSAAEQHMREEGMNILIRSSSSPSCCVVLCRIEDSLFFSYRLHECEIEGSLGYKYGECLYKNMDDFMQRFVGGVYQMVHDIRGFKYFYSTREEAVEYLKVPGKYLKYAICLSRKYPGFIEFLYENKQAIARIEGDGLQYKEMKFSNLEEFLMYAKQHFN